MDKLSGFKLYLLRKGKSSGTIEKHINCLSFLLSKFPDLKKEDLELFFLTLLEKNYSPGYLNNFVMALRQYGDYIGTNYRDIKYFTVKQTHKSTMSDSEIEAFLKLPCLSTHDPILHKLYTLFFKILAYSGMRPSEVAGLTINTVDLGRNLFILETTKTTPRSVPIAPTLLHDLTDHIADSHNMLFPQITRHKWKHHFSERLKRLGIKRNNLTTYSLRHSFITRWAGEDINIFKIQRIVGHKKIETTANYMHLVTKDLTTAMNKDPLARHSLPFYERMKMFREQVNRLLQDYATTREEEKELLTSLI